MTRDRAVTERPPMDPIAHTLTGAALAGSGLRRASPLASAALVVGANAPDMDILASFGADYLALAFRRGWTHGILAVAVWPFVVTGLLLAWDRFRRRRDPGRAPIRPAALLGLAALGVATHPTLDWLNNYGLRWLMPFDGRWFYGDALFIIDPWVWLALGGAVYLWHAPRGGWLAVWAAFWVLATTLMLFTPLVPPAARALWIAGLAAVLAAQAYGFTGSERGRGFERLPRAALAAVAMYMSITLLANIPARSAVRAEIERLGAGPVEAVMVGPVAANPFVGDVIAETTDAYYLGRWRWLATPRLELSEEAVPRIAHDAVVAAAVRTPEARRFLTWSRFPFYEVEVIDDAHFVHIGDLRYGGNERLAGPTVRVDKETRATRVLE